MCLRISAFDLICRHDLNLWLPVAKLDCASDADDFPLNHSESPIGRYSGPGRNKSSERLSGVFSSETATVTQEPPSTVCAYFPLTMACWVYLPPTSPSPYNPENFFTVQTLLPGTTDDIMDLIGHTVSNPAGTWGFGTVLLNAFTGTFDYSGVSDYPPGWHHYLLTVG